MNEIAETLRKYLGGQGRIEEKRRVKKRSSGMDGERKETKTEDQKNNADGKD